MYRYEERVKNEVGKAMAPASDPATRVRALSEIALMVYGASQLVESILYYDEQELFDYMASVVNDSDAPVAVKMQVAQTFHSICQVYTPFTHPPHSYIHTYIHTTVQPDSL